MNVYQKVSTVVALCLYFPLAVQILSGTVEQNLATFLLWGTLDVIAAVSIFKQKGNWHLPATYVAGCAVIVSCLLMVGTFKWTWFESLVSFVVLLCIVEWNRSGDRRATILSTMGMAIGGLAQMKDAFLAPEKMPILIYLGYAVANLLATKAGKDWSVKERLYPATCAGICVVIVLFSIGKYF